MGGDGEADGTRRTRWRGLVGISIARLWKRTMGSRSGRILATVAAVALTIALLVMVTGIALALASGGAVDDTDADVRVAPEDGTTLTTVDGVEEPRLGETVDRSEAIRSRDGVDHATPVLIEPVELQSAGDGESRRILLVGVVPDGEPRTVGGLSTADLEATGSSTGREIVLSTAAADRLDADAGDEIAVGEAHRPEGVPAPTVTATAVKEGGEDGTPIALVHLEDLQTLSGAGDGGLADEILVWGETDAAAAAAAEAYPEAAVESDQRTNPDALFGDGLAFATSVLALLVGVAICASFVATTAAMTVNDDRRALAVLASIGFPAHSRLTIVAISTLLTTLCGALAGIALGAIGIEAANAIASATVSPGAVARFHPVFVPYAVVVAFVSGLVAVPYPLAVAVRTSVLEEVGR